MNSVWPLFAILLFFLNHDRMIDSFSRATRSHLIEIVVPARVAFWFTFPIFNCHDREAQSFKSSSVCFFIVATDCNLSCDWPVSVRSGNCKIIENKTQYFIGHCRLLWSIETHHLHITSFTCHGVWSLVFST